MLEFKGTPGPWRAQTSLAYKPKVSAGKLVILRMEATSGNPDEEVQANLNLIAAAPDLLAACQAAEWNSLDLPEGVRTMLEAAIAKALGQ